MKKIYEKQKKTEIFSIQSWFRDVCNQTNTNIIIAATTTTLTINRNRYLIYEIDIYNIEKS